MWHGDNMILLLTPYARRRPNDKHNTIIYKHAKWHDKRDVAILSTKHGIEIIDTGKKNRNDEPILEPQIIID
jgi:hypothetical protein